MRPVSKDIRHITLLKQRAMLALVLFFGLLVTGIQYVPQSSSENLLKKELQKDANTDGNETYLEIDVQAVVPFATNLAQQTLYFIYDIFRFEKPIKKGFVISLSHSLPYWDILFENIIATNAP